MMPSINHTVSGLIDTLRLDRYIAENMNILSRSQIKARELNAKVNGKAVKVSRLVKNGDSLDLEWKEAEPAFIIPENIPLDIIFENDRVIVVNKKQGMVVHPGAGNRHGTFANALYYRKLNMTGSDAKEFPENSAGARPGIVHRLDKDTSGVMIAAYDDEALAFLSEQFKSRKAKKKYFALVSVIPKEKKRRIETFLSRDPGNRKRFTVSVRGKTAVTYYNVIKTWNDFSLLALRPKTGRTHQLRVHLRYLGNPIIGDPLYGFSEPFAGLMLHARSLTITLPGESEERIFKAPLPGYFKEMIKKTEEKM